ncbi:MAG: hypothetical protein COT18_08140 [Elusimicrobia bacterium CG08_land_8_20_14_0_20_59_10]|nr:MAG: hypothetical protein COT18_08140 [Elusimicrobia bacterium CG08_land_8_20_14_0_20_59_10]
MARRNENIFEFLVSLPWWVGVGSGAVLLLSSLAIQLFPVELFHLEDALSALFRIFAVFAFLCGILSAIMAASKGNLFNTTAGFTGSKAVTWQECVSLVAEYYRRKGYSVFEMGGDEPYGGSDLFAQKGGEKLIIQCKHWKTDKVNEEAVRALYGVMTASTASGAALITAGSFTRAAVELAKDKRIELIDGPGLEKIFSEAKAAAQQPPARAKSRATLIPTDPPPLKAGERDRVAMPAAMRAELEAREKIQALMADDPVCPVCKTTMVLRIAQRGPGAGSKFWGCPNYPRCRQTIPFRPG